MDGEDHNNKHHSYIIVGPHQNEPQMSLGALIEEANGNSIMNTPPNNN